MTDLPPLTEATVWAILNEELEDDIVNQLVWHYLGYRYDATSEQWDASNVIEGIKENHPEPPNFIESRPATMKLTRSIPKPNKQLLKNYLGFKGYSIDQLVPRLTRRATMANWLLSHMQMQGLLKETPQTES